MPGTNEPTADQEPEPTAGDEHLVIVDRVPAGNWVVEPHGGQVNFRARTFFGLLPVNGIFDRFGGELHVGEDGAVSGSLVIEAGSIQTGIDRRDEHLRSPEFLDVTRHPVIVFDVAKVERRPTQEMRVSGEERMTATGTLVVCERELELGFAVTVIAHNDHLHVEAKVKIDHDAAGLGFTRPGLVGKSIRADVALTLRPGHLNRPRSAPGSRA